MSNIVAKSKLGLLTADVICNKLHEQPEFNMYTKRQLEEVVNSQFRFVVETIRQGEYKGVKIPYIGKFLVKPGRLASLHNLPKKSLNELIDDIKNKV